MRALPAFLAITCLFLGGSSRAQVLYAATGSVGSAASLYTVDPATAVSTLVAPVTIGGAPIALTGLAFHPTTGVLYGITGGAPSNFRRSLVTIDASTGAATLIGTYTPTIISDITFGGDGTLYGWVTTTNPPNGIKELCSLNLTTGAVTLIGPPQGGVTEGGGLSFDTGGILYAAAATSTGSLYTVDKTTGTITAGPTLAGMPGHALNALAQSPANVLYGADSDRGVVPAVNLVRIDTATGALTVVGPLPAQTDALAFTGVNPVELTAFGAE